MPPGVVTVTSTVPVPAGLSAVIVVSLTTVTSVAGVVPKSTAVAPVKPVPVIVTNVPPAGGPMVGLMPETVGARDVSKQIGRRGGRRAARVGDGHVHRAGARRALGRDRRVADDRQVGRRRGAEVDPRGAGEAGPGDRHRTCRRPPDRTVGLTPVTVGAATYVNWSAGEMADVPLGVVTVTSTVPVPAGL